MREVAVEAHDLTGGTHFRSKQHIYGLAERRAETLEGQHGFLDGHLLSAMDVATVAMGQQQTVVALLLDGLAGHDAGRGLGQGHTGGLGGERHRTGRTWVGFDHIQRVGHEGVLHIDQTLHATTLGDGVGSLAQTTNLVVGQRAWRQGACGVSGVDAGFLDVLHDAADVQLLAVEQGIDVDFHGVLEELVDQQRRRQASGDDRIGLGLLQRTIDVLAQLGVVIDDFHASSAEHVARAHQHRVSDGVRGLAGLVQAQGGAVTRRVHVRLLQHLAEKLTVFGQVDGFRSGAEDRHAGGLQTCGERQRRLAAELHDNALDRTHLLLGLVDLQHILEGERFEVQAVGHVVIRGHGLRIAVDHDGVIVLAQFLHRVHAGVVELDALADAVRTGTEDDHRLAFAWTQLGLVRIAGVVIRRGRVEFGRAGVDGLVHRAEVIRPAQFADGVLAFVSETAQMGDLHIGQACELRLLQQSLRQLFGVLDLQSGLVDQRELADEPRIDLGGVKDLLFGGAAPQGSLNLQVTVLGRGLDGLEQLLDLFLRRLVAIPVEAHVALVDGAHRLTEGLLEVAAEGHGLAHGLHRRGQRRVGSWELLEREAWNLGDHVVDGRLEAGRRGLGDIVLNLVQRVAERQLGGDLGDREAGRLGCQGGRTGHTRVHLDDDDAAGVRIDGELNVAAAGVDAHAADDGDADVAQLLVFAVGQGEDRGDGDGITGVHADRIDVFDRADDHDVVLLVAHQLELVFLPAFDAFLDQHLIGRGIVDAGAGDAVQLLLIVGDTGAETTHGEAWANDQRVSELLRDLVDFREGVRDVGARRFRAGLLDDLLEQLAVLATVDGVQRSTDQFDVVLLEHAGLTKRHRGVQRGLAAKGRKQRIRTFFGDDLLEDRRGDRLDVGGIGHFRIGHDGGGVGIDQNDPDAFLTQDAARLGSRIVEFRGLADHDRAGADNHHGLDVCALRHCGFPPWRNA